MKIFILLFLFLCMLTHPAISVYLCSNALNLWFQCMLPALFPFMILSGIFIRQNLAEKTAHFFSPVLKPLFRTTDAGCYCLLLGFFCGFPMGAKTTADLYRLKRISRREACCLLAFCNNIGPSYFLGFLLPTLGISSVWGMAVCLFGMYGLPLLYGFILCRLSGRNAGFSKSPAEPKAEESFFDSLDNAITSAIHSITTLGGYMLFFNLLNLLPLLLQQLTHTLLPQQFFHCFSLLTEITDGVRNVGNAAPLLTLTLLHFGGLSCLAQTASCLKDTDLPLRAYILHKILQTLFAGIYYFLLFRICKLPLC